MADSIESNSGEIRISNDVISVIAGMALCEVGGLYLDGKLPDAFIDRTNAKNVSRLIKIDVDESGVSVSLIVTVEYGKNVALTCTEAQNKVKAAVQTMTGLKVAKVDILVTDLLLKKDAKEK